jgi:hypothetical protein
MNALHELLKRTIVFLQKHKLLLFSAIAFVIIVTISALVPELRQPVLYPTIYYVVIVTSDPLTAFIKQQGEKEKKE